MKHLLTMLTAALLLAGCTEDEPEDSNLTFAVFCSDAGSAPTIIVGSKSFSFPESGSNSVMLDFDDINCSNDPAAGYSVYWQGISSGERLAIDLQCAADNSAAIDIYDGSVVAPEPGSPADTSNGRLFRLECTDNEQKTGALNL